MKRVLNVPETDCEGDMIYAYLCRLLQGGSVM